MSHVARRCSAQRKDGGPCRAWAVRDSVVPLCASHQGQAQELTEVKAVAAGGRPGLYRSAYNLDEIASLLYAAEEKKLKDELDATRIGVLRVLEQMKQELEPAEFSELIDLLFKGTRTIAGIMRAQRSLSSVDKDQLDPDLEAALDAISEKVVVNL